MPRNLSPWGEPISVAATPWHRGLDGTLAAVDETVLERFLTILNLLSLVPTFPATSVALTLRRWRPECNLGVLYGEEQDWKGLKSTRHRRLTSSEA